MIRTRHVLMMLLLGVAPIVPLHAQGAGLLGDSDVTAGDSGKRETRRESRREGRKQRPKRIVDVAPYLELDQTAIVDLKGGNGDVLTYTSVAAGLDAAIETRSVSVGADLRYEHQFGWGRNSNDQDILSGIVNARVDLVRDMLSLEGGALATRVRTDGYTGANNSLVSADSTSNVYSAYIGPNFEAPIGDLTVTAAYRLGYNRVDSGYGTAAPFALPATSFEESWIHNANASVGMQPGMLPFGWSVGTGYVRESSSQLEQRFNDKFLRADVTLPVARTVALVGGVGYEKIAISNKDALRDANNVPIRDGNGRFVTDPASPRRLSYDDSGLIWDAGVLWRPSPRTSAEFRVGHRYGSMSYTGSLRWEPSRHTSISVILFDSIDSFGRALNGSLANLGTNFLVSRNPFSGDLTGCAFAEGQAGGTCFNDTLTGISTANYRNRGVFAQLERSSDPWTFVASAGFARRKYIGDSQSVLMSINGVADDNYFGAIGVTRALDAVSTFDANAYANYFVSGVSELGDVTNIGANVAYRRTIWRRLAASGAVGIDSIDRKGQEAFITLLAQLGLRYQF